MILKKLAAAMYYYMNSRYGGSQIAPRITMSGRYTP